MNKVTALKLRWSRSEGVDSWTGPCSFKRHHSHHSWQFLHRGASFPRHDGSTPHGGGQYFLPSFPCDLTLIYITFKVTPIPCFSLSCYFCIPGLGEVSQFNYLKMSWICMFICTAQSDLPLFVQCFNMQTTLVNQAGINTIIHHQTVRDGYLMYVKHLVYPW